MTVLMILAVAVLVLLGLSQLRVGGIAEYAEAGAAVWVRVGPFHLRVFPARRKKKADKPAKPAKKKPKKPPEGDTAETKPGGSLELLKELLPLLTETAGRVKRKIQIDRLYLDFTAAASDPAAAAMCFGYANVAIGMVWPVLEHNFNIKDRRIRTAVDFQRTAPAIYLKAAFSLTIAQGLSVSVRAMVQYLKIFSDYRVKAKQKEAV